MLESLRNIFSVAELRNRVLFTLGLLAVYRVGHQIPTPGVNIEALALLADQAKNTMFGLYDLFSGGNLSRVTIFALGIMRHRRSLPVRGQRTRTNARTRKGPRKGAIAKKKTV